MKTTNPFCLFRHELDTFSTRFQHLFADFRLFLLFFVFTLKIGFSLRVAETNRIQREFLFNDAIQSQNLVPASSHPRQKTNLFKLGLLSLRAADKSLA
jgi:hypothetical protein